MGASETTDRGFTFQPLSPSKGLTLPRRRPTLPIPLLLTVAAVCAIVAVYIFGLAYYQASGNSLFQPRDLLIPRTIDVVVALWCFWIGSSIGSFLNVVAWRLPRGESLNGRSHCPRCRSKLQARDNFPVFGWLALRGRCRTCRLPISPRYPIVEAAVGTSLTLVAIGELYQLSLPHQFGHFHGGPLWAPVIDRPILLMLFYHAMGIAIAWAFGLIRLDRQPLPASLIAFGLTMVVVPMCVYPALSVVSWKAQVSPAWTSGSPYADAVLRVITALVAASLLGRWLARGMCPSADPKLDPLGPSTKRLIDLIAILGVPTILVGWQASPALAVLASLIAVLLRRRFPRSTDALGSFALAMPIALTIQLFAWRYLYESAYWPSDGSSPWIILGWSAMICFVPLWLHDRGPERQCQVSIPADGPEQSEAEQADTVAGDGSGLNNSDDFD